FCNRNTGSFMKSDHSVVTSENRYISTLNAPCVAVDTTLIKKLGVTISAKPGEASVGRINVKAYDSLGVELINDVGNTYVTGFNTRSTDFGGSYSTPQDYTFGFEGCSRCSVSDSVAYVVIVVSATRLE